MELFTEVELFVTKILSPIAPLVLYSKQVCILFDHFIKPDMLAFAYLKKLGYRYSLFLFVSSSPFGTSVWLELLYRPKSARSLSSNQLKQERNEK